MLWASKRAWRSAGVVEARVAGEGDGGEVVMA